MKDSIKNFNVLLIKKIDRISKSWNATLIIPKIIEGKIDFKILDIMENCKFGSTFLYDIVIGC